MGVITLVERCSEQTVAPEVTTCVRDDRGQRLPSDAAAIAPRSIGIYLRNTTIRKASRRQSATPAGTPPRITID